MENILIPKKNLIGKIAQKYQLELLLLFGSRVSEETHRESDFDVAYLSKRNLDLMEEAKLICDLISIFKSDRTDLVNLKKAKPLLFYAIFQHCKILYARDNLIFPTLRAYAFKKYIETKPFYEEKFRRLQEKLKL